METNDIYIILAVLLLVLSAISNTLYFEKPTAEDWNRHGPWVERWIRGDWSVFFEYPPVFHWFMIAPVLILGFENIKYFQIILAILSTSSIALLAYKLEGKLATIIVLMILTTSAGYMQNQSALIPEALDFILFPLMVYAMFNGKEWITYSGMVAMFYMHYVALCYFACLLIYALCFRKDMVKWLLLCVVLSLPIILGFYVRVTLDLGNPIQTFGNITNNVTETHQLWQDPFSLYYSTPIEHYILFSGLLAWVLLPIVIYLMHRQRTFNKRQFFYAVWCLSFSPMILFQLWRATPYMMIPFAFFIASVISKEVSHG